jgi:glycosyltransferase involved in cell wall biosynthesis
MKKPSILLFIEYFLPGQKSGGPIQSILNLILILSDSYTIHVVTRDRDYRDKKAYDGITQDEWMIKENYAILYCSPGKITLSSVRKIINSNQYEFIYANSLFGNFTRSLLAITGVTQRPIIIAPRGELHEGALKLKAYKKIPYLKLVSFMPYGLVKWHATDQKEVDCIKNLFPDSKIGLVPVVLAPDTPKRLSVRQEYFKKPGSVRLLFLSRITRKKGLLFLCNLLAQITEGKVELSIYGPLEDEPYWNECKKDLTKLPQNCTVSYRGAVEQKDVRDILTTYDFFVLPTLGENFGHAIFEALSSGVPVLISDQTQWRDLVVKKAGWDLPLESSRWKDVLNEVISMGDDHYQQLSKGAKHVSEEYLTSVDFKKKYTELFSN